MLRDRTVPSRYIVAAWVLTGVALILVLQLHVLPALLAGMLVYELVHVIAPTMNKHLSDRRAKLIAVGLLSTVVVILVTIAIMGVIFFFKSDAGSISALLARMAEIIQTSRATMPTWMVGEIPASPEDLEHSIAEWLRTHAADVQVMGKQAGRMVVHTVVAMGSLLFLIVIHKLEYFLNARIVGRRIECHAWELLLAMLVMEAAFGIAGVFAAPIYYAYLKDELADRGLV